jgi:hypothetical protein
MSENKKLIGESFFKKETYSDKLKRKFPQYEPQDVRDEGQPKGFGGILAPTDKGLAVTDPQEAGKRVVSALGASIGVNSVRNIASKSIKSFPIVISESVDPETSVMLKRVLEEQYAEYMSLLISNQVVDISAYRTGEKEGNIAIQALSSVSSEDESKMLARKVAGGEVEPEDFLKNLTSYNLIRNEGKEYKTGNKTLDTLLEGAVIVPASESKRLVEFMVTNSQDIVPLIEADNDSTREEGSSRNRENERITLRSLMVDDLKMKKAEAENAISVLDTLRGYDKTSKEFSRMSTPDIVLSPTQLKDSINSSLGQILLDPKNAAIRDRFEKATFLLQSNRIAGVEWVEYLTKRLGIPVSKDVRKKVVMLYRYQDIIDPENYNRRLSRRDIRRIAENRKLTERTLIDVLSTEGRTVILSALALLTSGGATAAATFFGSGGVIGGAAGIGGSIGSAVTGTAATIATNLASSTGIAAIGGLLGQSLIAGAIVGVPVAAIVGIITGILQWRRKRIQQRSKIEGWERVEALIVALEEQQKSVRKLNVVDKEETEQVSTANKYADDNITATSAEVSEALESYQAYLSSLMGKSRPVSRPLSEYFAPSFSEQEYRELLNEGAKIIDTALKDNKEHEAAVLSEAIVSTEMPVELVATQKYEFDKGKQPEVLVVPKFTTRSQYAYGSTEYERKDLKDRKYNAPLLMTIKFKERYENGEFSDNELVAVIGILGVITRVPSKEMEYILSSNAEGKTLKGILEPEGDPSQLISDIIGINKIKKDVDNLPISSDVWQNLEKISRLAVSNSLAGRKNDNIANAHIVFAQKEVDNVRADLSVDYMKDIKLVKSLMKRYSAFTVMIANDVSERLYIFDSLENINWDVVPYSSFRNKDSGDQLNAMLNKMSSGRM